VASPVTAPRPSARRPAALLPTGIARLTGFALLGALGALEWQRMVTDLSAWLALTWVGVGLIAGAAVLAAGRLGPIGRHVVATLVALLALPAAWVVAGLDLGLFRESRWPELGDGIARGLEALSQVKLPYEGADPWPARTLQVLGSLLCVLAGLLCVWPRDRTLDPRAVGFPLIALVALLVLVAVPVVALGGTQPVVLGLAIAALTVLFLLLERVPLRPGLGVAALLALALVGAPALGSAADKEQPWFDYKSFAETLSPEDPVRFRWEHGDYGPINWDRTGAEVLRIATKEPSYWKVQTLDAFDGIGWRSLPRRFGNTETDVPERFRSRRGFTDRLDVRVRRLRGTRIVAAGTILNIRDSSRGIIPGPEEDSWVTRSELRAGDSYTAEVYIPRPVAAELAAAPPVLPGTRSDELRIRVPLVESWPGVPTSAPGAPPGYADVEFEGFDPFGPRGRADFPQLGEVGAEADAVLRRSPYARTWRLAQRLRRDAESPYAYVLAVNRHLQGGGFVYDERPAPTPDGQAPLEHFLFRSKAGYCQHYSAAMALLLRMGGVPARVATGFSPGGYSERRGAWIVRDTDAHSWVEVWSEGIGWVAFDPTPPNTPARSQIAALENEDEGDDASPFSGDSGATTSSGGEDGSRNVRGDSAQGSDGGGSGGGAGDDGSIPGWLAWPAGILGAVALALGALWLRARRRGDAVDAERAIAELQRALRRTGRHVATGTTLAQLEQRLNLSRDAAAYVRALRAGRYAPRSRPPSASGRAALRRDLSEGAGWVGRLRVLRSLPPRIFAR
jgi:transglutaminase-like putative cysteine protease